MTCRATRALAALFVILVPALASAQVVNVNPVPGNPAASGANLLNALAAIADNGATKPYVVKLAPGIYDVGSTVVAMKPYVDLEGSGQGATIVRGLGNDAGPLTAVVIGASPAEIRDLQIQSNGSGFQYSIALLLNQTATAVRNVTLSSSLADSNWGLRVLSASATIEDVNISVRSGLTGYGIAFAGGTAATPMVRRAVISVSGPTNATGIYADQSVTPRIRDVEISSSGATSYGIRFNYGTGLTGATLEVTNSRIAASASTTATGIDLNGDDTVAVTHTNITATALGSSGAGLRNSSPAVNQGLFLVDHCDLRGSTQSISAPLQAVKVGASKLDGPVAIGSPACVASFNGSYTPLGGNCL